MPAASPIQYNLCHLSGEKYSDIVAGRSQKLRESHEFERWYMGGRVMQEAFE